MLNFPPHYSSEFQPLDVSVFGPFKCLLISRQDNWMWNSPGKIISIYNSPSIVRDIWPRATTATNIIKGFKATCIFLFDQDVFEEADYAPSFVTDQLDKKVTSDSALQLASFVQATQPAQTESLAAYTVQIYVTPAHCAPAQQCNSTPAHCAPAQQPNSHTYTLCSCSAKPNSIPTHCAPAQQPNSTPANLFQRSSLIPHLHKLFQLSNHTCTISR